MITRHCPSELSKENEENTLHTDHSITRANDTWPAIVTFMDTAIKFTRLACIVKLFLRNAINSPRYCRTSSSSSSSSRETMGVKAGRRGREKLEHYRLNLAAYARTAPISNALRLELRVVESCAGNFTNATCLNIARRLL